MKIVKLDTYNLKFIEDVLENEGFLHNQIKNMLEGFVKFEDADDVKMNMPPVFDFNTYFESMFYLSDIHKHKKTEDKQRLQEFKGILKVNNISPSQAIALNFYSFEGERVLSYKRQLTNKETQKTNAKNILIYQIQSIPSSNDKKELIYSFLKENKFSKRNYIDIDKAEKDIDNLDINNQQKYVIFNYVCTLKRILNLDKNIKHLDKCLKNQIIDNLVVYRGISSKFLYQNFQNKLNPLLENFDNIIGEKIEEKGYLSTSSYIDSSFAHFPNNDVILEIFVPKGSQGFDISPFSNYTYEYELLFNSCDLFIFDQKNIKYLGNKKILLSCFLISKEKECYNGLIDPHPYSQNDYKINEGEENA